MKSYVLYSSVQVRLVPSFYSLLYLLFEGSYCVDRSNIVGLTKFYSFSAQHANTAFYFLPSLKTHRQEAFVTLALNCVSFMASHIDI